MSRLSRFATPATLALVALLGACSPEAGDEPEADSGAAAPVTSPGAAVVDTPLDTAPPRDGETELTGIVFRMPPGHTVRTTGGGADYRLYAIAPVADSTAPLVEFYLGDRPQFDANATRESRIHGLLARDRVAKLPEGRWSRELLLELPRSGPSTADSPRPTRVHLWYNRLPAPAAATADTLISSFRCCVRSVRSAPAGTGGGSPGARKAGAAKSGA